MHMRVISKDMSTQQINYTPRHPNLMYIVTLRKMLLEDLESTIGAEGSMDLSSSPGSSLFNLHTFYTHVKHVLWKPNGCLHVVFGASAHSW